MTYCKFLKKFVKLIFIKILYIVKNHCLYLQTPEYIYMILQKKFELAVILLYLLILFEINYKNNFSLKKLFFIFNMKYLINITKIIIF